MKAKFVISCSFQCDVSPCWKLPEATVETLTTLALELGASPASLPHIAASHIKLCCEISSGIFFLIAIFFTTRLPSPCMILLVALAFNFGFHKSIFLLFYTMTFSNICVAPFDSLYRFEPIYGIDASILLATAGH